jgi:hypothetical protein
MKSLNDNLREEFREILSSSEFQDIIKSKRLDSNIINGAFDKLLQNKTGSDEVAAVEKGRAEFETYIINTLRTKGY